jgi:hypothetical protein
LAANDGRYGKADGNGCGVLYDCGVNSGASDFDVDGEKKKVNYGLRDPLKQGSFPLISLEIQVLFPFFASSLPIMI